MSLGPRSGPVWTLALAIAVSGCVSSPYLAKNSLIRVKTGFQF
ncbi:MAG: hypothetical protein WBW88_15665 [Rhodothermales bacterium]